MADDDHVYKPNNGYFVNLVYVVYVPGPTCRANFSGHRAPLGPCRTSKERARRDLSSAVRHVNIRGILVNQFGKTILQSLLASNFGYRGF